MKDTVYLSYGADKISGMTKTPPRKNRQYVKVTVDVPEPPSVTVTVPSVSPTVEATNFVEPDVVVGRVWCQVVDDVMPEEGCHDCLPIGGACDCPPCDGPHIPLLRQTEVTAT